MRQLASITPPESFRARVFAAIEAEKVAFASGVAAVAVTAPPVMTAWEDTQPQLPVIRVRNTHVRRSLLPQRSGWQRAGLGLAAALLLSAMGARLIPLMEPGLANLAQSLVNATTQQPRHHAPAPQVPSAQPNH